MRCSRDGGTSRSSAWWNPHLWISSWPTSRRSHRRRLRVRQGMAMEKAESRVMDGHRMRHRSPGKGNRNRGRGNRSPPEEKRRSPAVAIPGKNSTTNPSRSISIRSATSLTSSTRTISTPTRAKHTEQKKKRGKEKERKKKAAGPAAHAPRRLTPEQRDHAAQGKVD